MLDGQYSRKLASVLTLFFLLGPTQCDISNIYYNITLRTFYVGEYNLCGMGNKEPEKGSQRIDLVSKEAEEIKRCNGS